MTERVPRLFVTALADLTQWLEASGVPAMIVGGIAASILGRPRATRDIDALAMAPDEQWARLLGSSEDHGILPRIENPLEFAHRTRVLLLRHTESGIDIDVILGGLPFEAEAVSRAKVHNLGGVHVRLPQLEDPVSAYSCVTLGVSAGMSLFKAFASKSQSTGNQAIRFCLQILRDCLHIAFAQHVGETSHALPA